jgi:hypothetical protein
VPDDTSLTARLAALRTCDVAVLVADVVVDVRHAIQRGDLDAADDLLATWETALGGDLERLGAVVVAVQGRGGYTAALAAFSRGQARRRESVGWFRDAVRARSRRRMDRWVWAVAAYRQDVERFAATRALTLANAADVPRARDAVRRSSLKTYRVLDAARTAHAAALRAAAGEDPALQRHRLTRLDALVAESTRLDAERARALADRDTARAAAEAFNVVVPRAAIARLSSVAAQARAYRGLVQDAEDASRAQATYTQCERLKADLAALVGAGGPLRASGDDGARSGASWPDPETLAP